MPNPDDLLKADFKQCFKQMRHYDSIFTTLVIFAFVFFTAVVTATIVFSYQAHPPNSAYLGLSILYGLVATIGVLILAILLRNRVSFAFSARFVNEVRGYYLSQIDSNFKNKTGLPVSSKFPRILNPGSVQTIQMYFVVLFNAAFASASILTFRCYSNQFCQDSFVPNFWFFAILTAIALIIQICWIILYLRSKDNFSADHGFFWSPPPPPPRPMPEPPEGERK